MEEDDTSESDDEDEVPPSNTSGRTASYIIKHHRFTKAHPLAKTHGHRDRTHKCWTRYSGKRLPDYVELSDDSHVPHAEKTEKREFYAQAVLVMFCPFRVLTDLLDESETWWEAYLRKAPDLLADPKISSILSNMQDFYESFCRTSQTEAKDEEIDPEFVRQMVADGEVEDDAHEIPDIAALEIDAQINCDDTEKLSDFVKTLAACKQCPLHLKSNTTATIDSSDAAAALKNVHGPRSKNNFTLPGRASVGLSLQECLAETEKNQRNSHLDTHHAPVRIDIMEKLAAALRDVNYPPQHENIANATKISVSFPTLKQHSSNCNLDEDQHAAFILCGTALLQHISASNKLDPSIHGAQAQHITQEITDSISKLLNEKQQLILYLGNF